MSIKGIVFDKDGTLIDYEACWVDRTRAASRSLLHEYGADAAYEPIMKRLGILNDGSVDIKGALCHGTYADISTVYAEEISSIGVKTEPCRLLTDVKQAFYRFRSLAKTKATYDKTKELFLSLKNEGIKLGLVTTDDKDGAFLTLSSLGIFDLFDITLFSDDIHPTKPDPYFMRVFMEKTGLLPCEILMVGDTLSDMLFGKNCGVYTLGVGKNEGNRKILGEISDYTAPDVSFIPEILNSIRTASLSL